MEWISIALTVLMLFSGLIFLAGVATAIVVFKFNDDPLAFFSWIKSYLHQIKDFFGLYPELSLRAEEILSFLPLILIGIGYVVASEMNARTNPDYKLLPTIGQMWRIMLVYTNVPDCAWFKDFFYAVIHGKAGIAFGMIKSIADFITREGMWNSLSIIEKDALEILSHIGKSKFVVDTYMSMFRLLTGLGFSAMVALFFGVHMGLFPLIRSSLATLLMVGSAIPPLAILPIIYIYFGVDETSKIVLIFIGTSTLMLRDIFQSTGKIPREQIVKALTLGLSHFKIVYKVALPQMFPRLLEIIPFGWGIIFLITSEAIASTYGLGFRIFLVRRYLAMDIIYPYVLWITFIAYLLEYYTDRFNHWKSPWYFARENGK